MSIFILIVLFILRTNLGALQMNSSALGQAGLDRKGISGPSLVSELLHILMRVWWSWWSLVIDDY